MLSAVETGIPRLGSKFFFGCFVSYFYITYFYLSGLSSVQQFINCHINAFSRQGNFNAFQNQLWTCSVRDIIPILVNMVFGKKFCNYDFHCTTNIKIRILYKSWYTKPSFTNNKSIIYKKILNWEVLLDYNLLKTV